VQHEEIANRIRTRVGEDPRTLHLPRLNVEVNDDVAEIYGEVPSDEDRRAVEEIATDTDGVNEVRIHLAVNPQSPTRENKAAGGESDQPS
jgi:osmotically-inducible protein OsmY